MQLDKIFFSHVTEFPKHFLQVTKLIKTNLEIYSCSPEHHTGQSASLLFLKNVNFLALLAEYKTHKSLIFLFCLFSASS